MLLNSFFVLIQPILVTCIDDVLCTLILKDFDLFSSSDNIEKRNVLFLTEFIQHSSQSWSGSSIDQTFCFWTSVAPFSKSVYKPNNSNWVDDTWGSWFNWNIFINNPAILYISNSVFSPCTIPTIERYFFANEMLSLSTTSFDNFTISFKATNKVWLSSPIPTLYCNSVRWIYSWSNNFDLDLVDSRLRNIKYIINRRFFEFLNNESFLLLVLH